MKAHSHLLESDACQRSLALVVLLLGALVAALQTKAAPFAEMTLGEVNALLEAGKAVSAKDAALQICPASGETVEVTAADMMSKVYGVLKPDCTKKECIAGAARLLSLTPEEDEGVLWLECDGGYHLSYYGQTPDVSAMARFGGGDAERVSDYGYFFLFPYAEGADTARDDFCITLLQEMHDMGLEPGVNVLSDDIFEVVADYQGSEVDVRLLDDPASARYVLILSVTR